MAMIRPTPEGVIALYEVMISRAMTQEQKIAMRAKFAAMEAREARDRANKPRLDFKCKERWESLRGLPYQGCKITAGAELAAIGSGSLWPR